MKHDQQGFGLISLLFIAATMIFGYVVISRVLARDDVQQVTETANSVLDDASETIDKANETIDGATQLIETTNN